MKIWFLEKFTWQRFFMSFVGVVLLGPVVALLRKSELGTDPWTCLVVGVANVCHSTYGFVYPVIIGILLVIVFFVNRYYIGLATVLNLFLVGPLADLCKNRLDALFTISALWQSVVCLILALVILCIASSLYITADLGVSSYDAMALILADKLPVQFRWCRIATDVLCTVIAFICLPGIWSKTIGVGTVITAFFMGPFTQFCCVHIAQPLLNGGRSKFLK